MDFSLHKIPHEIEIEGFNSIYYFEFDKNFSHLPEKHDNFWELVYVDGGDITAITDGFAETLTEGQVIFHKPGEIHAHISNKIVANKMLVISFTTKSPAMAYFDRKVFTLDKTAKTLIALFLSESKNALKGIPNEYENKNPLDFSTSPFGSVQLLECYLTEFLIILKRSNINLIDEVILSEASRVTARSSIMDMITGYLEENIYTSITLNDICNQFLMCKTKVCDLFNEHLSSSPIEYFNSLKIREAKKLLKDESLSVSTIASMLGYVNIHSFSRAFKHKVGVSPAIYRKSILT